MPLTTFHVPVNDATSRVAAPRAVGAPVVVTAGTGSLFGSSFPILLTVTRGTPGTFVTELEATGRAGDTLTISGPAEGATDVALLAGDAIECRPTALALAEIHGAVHALEAAPGGVAIGGAISGGTAGRVLLEGTGPVMADSANLTFGGTTLNIGGITAGPGAGAGNPTVFGASAAAAGTDAAAFGREASAGGQDSVAFGPFSNASGGSAVAIIGVASGAAAVAIGTNAVASHNFSVAIGDSCPSFGAGNISLGTAFNDPTLSLGRFSSTDVTRQIAGIKGTFLDPTDATFTGRVTVGAYDWAGFRAGLTIDADGTQAIVTLSGVVMIGALSGLLKATAGVVSAATAGTDYLTPTGDGSALTGLTGSQITGNIAGNAASITGSIAESQVTGLTSDLALKAPLASPTFTGVATIPAHVSPTTAENSGAFNLAASDWHSRTLDGTNGTLSLANPAVDQQFTIVLKQDATGSRTVTWFSGILWTGGTVPTLTTTASKRDIFTFKCESAGVYLGFVAGQNI